MLVVRREPLVKLLVFAEQVQQSLVHHVFLWAADELGVALHQLKGRPIELVARGLPLDDLLLVNQRHAVTSGPPLAALPAGRQAWRNRPDARSRCSPVETCRTSGLAVATPDATRG